jgi:KDO2-lipid IV(A) lauroyltransferase
MRLGSAIARRLPVGLTYALLSAVAQLLARLAPNRHLVRRHMARVTGLPISDPKTTRLAAEVYRTAAWNYFDLLRFPSRSREDLQASISIDGLENMLAPLQHGKGGIVATVHLGGFDVALHSELLAVAERGVIVEPLDPPELMTFVSDLRSSTGVQMLPADSAGLRRAIALLRSNGLLGIAIDRDIQQSGIVAPFFGQPARLPTGAATLSVRTGAPIVPAWALRTGGDRVTGFALPPIYPDLSLPREEAESRLFEQLRTIAEDMVRRAPGQWVVFEPVWVDEYAVKHPGGADRPAARTADAR